MKTFIKTFRNDNRVRLEREANEYAERNNLEIINISYAVRPFNAIGADDAHYLAVVYRRED